MFRRTASDSVFHADVEVIICPIDELHQELSKDGGIDQSDMSWRNSNGKTIEHTDFKFNFTRWIVWFPPTWEPATEGFATLVHEAVHLTSQILRNRGLKLTTDSEETYAYYADAMFCELVLVMDQYDAHCKRKRRRRRSA